MANSSLMLCKLTHLGMGCSASSDKQSLRNGPLQETHQQKKNTVFVTGIFASSVICLIWQNVVRKKQRVQTNYNTLSRKPLGTGVPYHLEGHVQYSDPSATTGGAQFA